MKKRIISLAAAAVFVIGTLAGCGNSSTQTTDKTASSDASSSGGDLVTVRDAVMTGQLDQNAVKNHTITKVSTRFTIILISKV